MQIAAGTIAHTKVVLLPSDNMIIYQFHFHPQPQACQVKNVSKNKKTLPIWMKPSFSGST
jgi:hypothetical protein